MFLPVFHKVYMFSSIMYVMLFIMYVLKHHSTHGEHTDSVHAYEHIRITNYEDFLIRKQLDSDFDLIRMRPFLALKKIEKTIKKYPNRYRITLLY